MFYDCVSGEGYMQKKTATAMVTALYLKVLEAEDFFVQIRELDQLLQETYRGRCL